jgi:hypothetical protein
MGAKPKIRKLSRFTEEQAETILSVFQETLHGFKVTRIGFDAAKSLPNNCRQRRPDNVTSMNSLWRPRDVL